VTGVFDSEGYADGKKGRTIFPFAFLIPSDAPSSYCFQRIGKLAYVVSGVVRYRFQGRIESMFVSSEATVLECCERISRPLPVTASVIGLIKPIFSVGSVKSKSCVILCAALEKNLYQAGSEVYIQVHVKNQSKKQVLFLLM
jgi:hypothetical protein